MAVTQMQTLEVDFCAIQTASQVAHDNFLTQILRHGPPNVCSRITVVNFRVDNC